MSVHFCFDRFQKMAEDGNEEAMFICKYLRSNEIHDLISYMSDGHAVI